MFEIGLAKRGSKQDGERRAPAYEEGGTFKVRHGDGVRGIFAA